MKWLLRRLWTTGVGAVFLGCGWHLLRAAPTAKPPTPRVITRAERLLLQSPGKQEIVYQVEYSPDGRMLVAATLLQDERARPNRLVRLWDPATGRLRRTVAGGYLAAFSPDNAHLGVAGFDGTVKVWLTALDRPPVVLHPSGIVSDLTFSPDSHYIGLNIDDHEIYMELWDARTGQAMAGPRAVKSDRFQAPDGATLTLRSFSPDSQQVNTFTENGVQMWDIATGRIIPQPPKRYPLPYARSRIYSPDRRTIAAVETLANGYPLVVLHKADSEQKIKALHPPALKSFRSSNDARVTFSPDSCKLAVVWEPASNDFMKVPAAVQLWDVPTRRLIATLQDKDKAVQGPAPMVRFTSDSRLLTVCGGYALSNLKIRDASTGQLVRTLQGKGGDFTAVDLSPDGQRVASGGEDGQVRIWSIR